VAGAEPGVLKASRTKLGAALLLASWLVRAAAVPTPESHFGHRIGEDRTVLDWSRVVSYFRALEHASDRILVRELGRSTEGRSFLLAVISSPATLKRLEHYREIQTRLADPRLTSPEQAGALIAEGRTVVAITCSIHATEIASTHTAVEFTYRLLTEDSPRFRQVLDNTILLLVPSLNPDGVDLVSQWYRKTLGTPFEGTAPPELYHRYAGHDNNRDWYFFTQRETRLTVSEVLNAWRPQIVYDVHQMGPFGARMFVPPWTDPIDPNIDPLVVQQCNLLGAGIAADLTAAGKAGVVVNAIYDLWSPSRHYTAYHGGLRILSESASARIASPIRVDPEQLDRHSAGYNARQASWNFAEVWPGGTWRLRDIIEYQSLAWESLLRQAAMRREDLLRNFYLVGARALERTSPYAFIVPAAQRDHGAARKLLETLALGLVEIERARGEFEASGRRYPAGSHVILVRQPCGAFAKTLLERQRYPDLRAYPDGPPRTPYDGTAHTLPLLLGVEVHAAEAPFEAGLERVEGFRPRSGRQAILPAADTDSWRELNRLWDAGREVWRDPVTGDFSAQPPDRSRWRPLRRPRVALYRSHVPVIDEGWTRWVLEQFGFAYLSAGNKELAGGRLRQLHDVIVFPDQSATSIEQGFRKGAMPEEYCGGLGEEAVAALRQFLLEGGTLIFLNRSAEWAADKLGLPVRNVAAGLPEAVFYAPGSLLRAAADVRHPLTLGLPPEISIWSQGSPAWEVDGGNGVAVVRYPDKEVLASGFLLGEKLLAGKAALVSAPMGSGKVILFGMKPQYRGQSYLTFKLFFNALIE
jgi:hypothetical protein